MKAEVFYFFIFLLACFPVFWLLNLNIVKKFTYKPGERYLQFRVFIVGFLFSIIFGNTMSASFALTVIDMFINSPNVSGFLNMILPNRAFELLYMLLCTIGLNVMYMLAFTVALGAARLIFIKAKRFIEFNDCVGAEKIFHAPWFIVNKFYSMKDDRVVLSKTGYVIGKWCKVMKRAFAVIFAAELGILYYSILWGSDAWNSAVLAVSKAVYLLPMLAFVLIEQLQIFFEAPEDTENGTVSSTDTNEELIGDLGALTYKYSETFGPVGNIICIDTRKDTYQRSAAYVGKDLANQQIMDCREPEILKVLNNQLSSSVTMQNIHYQNAVVSLLNGSDITVRDNFDGEFLVYLCTYLNHFLMQGRRVLFLCAREKDIMTIKAALEKTLGRMNNLGGVWKYAALGEYDYAGNTNALICTYEELIHTDLRSDYAGFADDLFFTVIADANTFLQLDNIRLSLIFGKLSALRVMQQYAFITDTYAPAVESRIKVFLGNKRGLAAYSNDARTPNTDIIVWKDESSYKPQCTIFREGYRASPHLGTALPLALIAVKDDIPQVSIVSHPERGDSYFFDVAGRSNAQRIVEYLESPEYDLKSIIRYLPAEAGDTKDLKLLFVYDTEYNFINTLWKWLKYGGTKGTLINVISPFYMMREYFAANYRSLDLLITNNEFTPLLPERTATRHSRLSALLALLAERDLTEQEVIAESGVNEKSTENGQQNTDLMPILRAALETVLKPGEIHDMYACFRFNTKSNFRSDGKGFDHTRFVRLTDRGVIDRLKEGITQARAVLQSNDSVKLPILAGNIPNYYLPAQLTVISGSYYTVSEVSGNTVKLSSAEPTDIPEYFAASEFILRDYRMIDPCTNFQLGDINICEANVERRIYGYASCSKGNDLYDRSNFSFSGDWDVPVRMEAKNVPVLELRLLKESFPNNGTAENAVTLLSVILNGMFRTLFPGTWQNIFAMPGSAPSLDFVSQVMKNANEPDFDTAVRAIIPHVNVHRGLKNSSGDSAEYVCLYIVEMSVAEYGMVQMLAKNIKEILKKVYNYLNWYIAYFSPNPPAAPKGSDGEGAEGAEKPAKPVPSSRRGYLHFGAPDYPTFFAPGALLNFLKRLLTNEVNALAVDYGAVEDVDRVNAEVYSCDFCGKRTVFAWKLNDGRKMCLHCHEHQKTQREEIEVLFRDTQKELMDHYKIKIPEGIHVRFRNAEEIRKARNRAYSEHERVVGFYDHNNRRLWIESRGPAAAMTSTIIHELTHAWQTKELPLDDLLRALVRALRKKGVKDKHRIAEEQLVLLLEGHAAYVEIDAMKERHEEAYSTRLAEEYTARTDIYGLGYNFLRERIDELRTQGSQMTPFTAMEEIVRSIIDGRLEVPCLEESEDPQSA